VDRNRARSRAIRAAAWATKTSRILPGLLDVQVNGAFGDDFADPSADMDRICRGMLTFGVTRPSSRRS